MVFVTISIPLKEIGVKGTSVLGIDQDNGVGTHRTHLLP